MFEDRRDAGEKLARALKKHRGKDVIVLSIPRGGVEVGYEVAKYLDADFSLIIVRKLPYPDNPEAGFGAIAEDGSLAISEHAARWVPREAVDSIIRFQGQEIQRRIHVLRSGKSLPDLAGRTVILVDDGIAMGSTMRASIRLCQNGGAGKIIVAVPVSGAQAIRQIERTVDEVVVLERPRFFRAVAQVYRNWHDVSDAEVLEVLQRWRRERHA